MKQKTEWVKPPSEGEVPAVLNEDRELSEQGSDATNCGQYIEPNPAGWHLM